MTRTGAESAAPGSAARGRPAEPLPDARGPAGLGRAQPRPLPAPRGLGGERSTRTAGPRIGLR